MASQAAVLAGDGGMMIGAGAGEGGAGEAAAGAGRGVGRGRLWAVVCATAEVAVSRTIPMQSAWRMISPGDD
jgi:hypothetical protein